ARMAGRVVVTVGGSGLDNGTTGDNRVFLSPQVFEGLDATTGTEVLEPSVDLYGWCPPGSASAYMTGSRSSLLDELKPGQVYYARIMMAAETDGDKGADVTARHLIVEPVS